MKLFARHLSPEGLGRSDPQDLYSPDHVPLEGLEVIEFSIKMTGEKQSGILQLALCVAQGAFSKIQNDDCSADYDGRDQHDPAKDKPVERIAPF
jgi:hypothetical protein